MPDHQNRSPKKSTLTNSEKAAILFLLIGEETSAEVFKSLNDHEIQHVTQYITNMSTPTRDEIEGVIKECLQKTSARQLLPEESVDYITSVLVRSVGEKKASHILRKLQTPVNISSKGSLGAIKDLDAEMLFNILHSEHPQIVALVLSHLSPEKSAEVLRTLPEEARKDVALRICKLDRISPKVIEEINHSLATRLIAYKESESKVVGGVNQIAQILNSTERASEEIILNYIEEHDPELAESIKMLMFTFEDLATASDKDMQTLLKDVPKDTLCLAMKTASDSMRRLVLRNMSKRAADMLIEDVEALGAVKLNLVEKAQQEIVQLAKRLEDEGSVTIKSKGMDDVLV
ncbi:MAG: flagellar motor switch protein FliG [bacterium]